MSKTDENLKAAFTGESLARNKYAYYAEIARKEGYRYISKILEETAENEKYHALEEFRLLQGEKPTAENLEEAIGSEDYEAEVMYPQFAREAEVEGNKPAEILFSQIAKIERHHRERFKKILEMVEAGMVYKRTEAIKWKCSICGYTYEGTEPPNRCPYCKKPKEYYEPANLDV
jgi:rubrerythrin